MRRNTRTLVLVVCALVLVIVLVKVRAARVRQLQASPKLQSVPTPVRVASVHLGQVLTSIDETGILLAETESAIAPQVMARCIDVSKREGDAVRAGEVIARLDDQELQNAQAAQTAEMLSGREAAEAQRAEVARAREDLAAREASVSEAEAAAAAQRADVERARENLAAAQAQAATQGSRTARDKILYENKAISLEQWEASQTTAKQTDAAVAVLQRQIDALSKAVDAANHRIASLKATAAGAQQQIVAQTRTAGAAQQKAEALASTAAMGRTRLGYTVIRAPYHAVVTARLAEPGDLLAPGQPIYRILKPGSVKVRVNVPQESLSFLRVSAPARLTGHGQEMRATISRVYPALSGGRLGTVEIDLSRPPFGLKSGSTLEVALQTQSATGLVVPIAALFDSDRGSFVYVVQQSALRLAPVRVMVRGDTEAVISGPLHTGDHVVIGQSSELMSLHDGQQVAPSGERDGHEIR